MEVLQNVLLKLLQQWTPTDSCTLSYFCASSAILYEAQLGSPSGVTTYISEGGFLCSSSAVGVVEGRHKEKGI